MWRNRIIYLLFLLSAIAYYAVYSGWISAFLIRLAVILPLVSLVPALICSFFMKAELKGAESGIQGEEKVLSVRLNHQIRWMPLTFRIRLKIHNVFLDTAEVETRLVHEGEEASFLLPFKHCGNLNVHIEQARMIDLLGLFRIPVRKGMDVRITVFPQKTEGEVHLLRQPVKYVPMPPGSFSEDHDLRLYAPGDSLNSVHWKLSSKTGELIIRQPVKAVYPAVILSFDRGENADETDRILARVQGISDCLIEQGISHYFAIEEDAFAVQDHDDQKRAWTNVFNRKEVKQITSAGIIYHVGREDI